MVVRSQMMTCHSEQVVNPALGFFAEIIDGVALLLAQPSRNRNQQ